MILNKTLNICCLLNHIEELRSSLHNLVKRRDNLSDLKVLKISKELDKLLFQYYDLLKKQSLVKARKNNDDGHG